MSEMAPDSSQPTPHPINEQHYYSTMVHFYRGEIGRIMVWRQRLDATTNWAIISASAILTFALSHPEITHVVFMIANAMVFLLLIIEGRRYRYYDAFRARVRMLEAHFLVPVVMRRQETSTIDWRELLAEDLLLPSFKIGFRESISRRLRRNYVWIFSILLGAWVLKVYLHGGPAHGPLASWKDFWPCVEETQPFHPILFWLSLIGFYGLLIFLIFYSQKERYATGELTPPPPSRPQWRI